MLLKLLVLSGYLCSLEHVEASSLLSAYEILTFPGLVCHYGMGYFILVDSFLLLLFDGIRIGGNVEDVPLLQEEEGGGGREMVIKSK